MTKKAVLVLPSTGCDPLFQIGDKPVLSHILEKLPEITDILLLGVNALNAKDFLECAYPFVNITCNEEEVTHLHNSIFGASALLQEPFLIVDCNFILGSELSAGEEDWSSQPIVHIRNYGNYWANLTNGTRHSEYVEQLPEKELGYIDISTPQKLNVAKTIYSTPNNYDFSKPDESIFFVQNRVIKYFKDKNNSLTRAKRTKFLNGLTPDVDRVRNNFYSYELVPGKTMYNSLEPGLTTNFLNWCSTNLWQQGQITLNPAEKSTFMKACLRFYRDKTMERIEKYWKSSNHSDAASIVNGTNTPPLAELIKRINWNLLLQGEPSKFHGDLQFDNVIYSPGQEKQFTLLDWRQDFAGLEEYGDRYYDLAKLYGGLILPYNSIKKNEFSYVESAGVVELSLTPPKHLEAAREEYRAFAKSVKYDTKKIQILTGLIFINMSPLHTQPFNYFLHHLGKLILTKVLYG